MSLKDTQKSASAEITALSSLMQEAGVDPGTLRLMLPLGADEAWEARSYRRVTSPVPAGAGLEAG